MTPVFVITLGDVVGILVAVVAVFFALAIWLPTFIKQARCKHDSGVRETMACEAICNKCGANLGFIGAWREKNEHSRSKT